MAQRLRHGEGSIERRSRADGSTAYRAVWRGEDGAKRRQTFDTEAQAVAHLEQVYRQKRRGTYRDPSSVTVAAWMATYIERGQRRWKGGTAATYDQRSRAHIVPHLGRLKLSSLTTPRIQQWVDTLDRAKLAANTIASAHTLLSGALKEARTLGLIDANPAQGVRLPSPGEQGHSVWTAAEARAVLACVRDDPRKHALYQVALSTGMRPGEVRALRWEDIDLDRAQVLVRRTVTKNPDGGYAIREATKSGRTRTVALPLPCAVALRAWQARHPHGYVFGTEDHALKDQTWAHWHARICAKAKVTEITRHEMRHTAATLLLGAGVHPKVVQEMLGHTTIGITMDIYSHVNETMLRTASQTLATVLGDEPLSDATTPRKDVG